MLKIKEAIVVEGRYDKNTLSQLVDGVILETSGFGIFKDEERLALLRRCGIQHSGEIAVGGCTLHADTLLVTGEGFSYELRPREFALLQTLLAAPTKIFTRQMLMDELWGYDSESDPRTVDTHIRRLREKLAGVPDFEIQTVRGLGYRAVIR